MSTNPLCLKRALLLKSVWGFASSHHATRYNPIRSDRSFADSESDGDAEDGEAFWPGRNRRPGCPPCGGLSWDCRNQENMRKSSGWWGTCFFLYIGNHNPNLTFIFFRGIETTNQVSVLGVRLLKGLDILLSLGIIKIFTEFRMCILIFQGGVVLSHRQQPLGFYNATGMIREIVNK